MPDRDPLHELEASFDRFTRPNDIPDHTYWRDGDTLADAQARRDAARAEDEADEARARGYKLKHPAGRGWKPEPDELELPEKHCFPMLEHDGVKYVCRNGTPPDLVAKLGTGQVFDRERRARFLDHLSLNGNARAAAVHVRVSHETAYRARRQDPQFARLWEAAMVHARAYGEQVLATRALDGYEVAVVRGGEIVGYVTKHDPRLLLAHLARLDRRVEADEGAEKRARHFDPLLAEYLGHAVPREFYAANALAPGWSERDEDLPATREDYVKWCVGRAIAQGPRKGEDARIAAAEKDAGKFWDAWHAGAIATVGKALGEGEGLPSPLPRAGGAGGGPVGEGAPIADTPTPNPSRKREGDQQRAPEVKSAPRRLRRTALLATVSHPSTPHSARAQILRQAGTLPDAGRHL